MPSPQPAASPRLLWIALGLAWWCRAAPLQAAPPAPAAGSGAASAGTPCPTGAGSLAQIGCQLAAALGAAAAGADVAVVGLTTERELPAPGALRERVRSSVESALHALLPAAHDRVTGGLRVELRLQQSGATLRVTADLQRRAGFWQRLRKRETLSLRHAFAEAPLDAELRSLIPPPPLVVSQVLKVRLPERGVIALACGAFGPNSGQELALVSRAYVRVGHIAGSSFSERRSVAWSALSPVAPAPLREPIASAEITAEGALRVGISDRRDGLELDAMLDVKTRFPGALPVPGGGCAARQGVGFSGELAPCAAGEPTRAVRLGKTIDAFAGNSQQTLGRDLASSQLLNARGEPWGLGRSGAQLALGDLDGDGAPELAYSADVLEPAQDRLSLITLERQHAKRRFELVAPSITAVALCARPEGPGMAPLALVSGDELWLIR